MKVLQTVALAVLFGTTALTAIAGLCCFIFGVQEGVAAVVFIPAAVAFFSASAWSLLLLCVAEAVFRCANLLEKVYKSISGPGK